MQLTVLGCDGGIGAGRQTTSMLIDDDVLIDCGSGLQTLSIGELSHVRHILLTHSHLDHLLGLPLLADTVFGRHDDSIIVHGLQATLDAVHTHILNRVIWPDFTTIPAHKPLFRLQALQTGDVLQLGNRQIEVLPAEHQVPGVGYRVESEGHSFAFSGDTCSCPALWQALNAHDSLDLLLVESGFDNSQAKLARLSCHFHPAALGEDIQLLQHDPPVYISHPKPGLEDLILAECRAAMPDRSVHLLRAGQTFQW